MKNMENKTGDRVVNEARGKAIENTHIPRYIQKSYDVCVEPGKIILSKKKQ